MFYSLGEIIPRILAFLLLPILTRHLTTEEYGINSYINSVMAFIMVIASLSLNTYVLRQYYLEKDELEKKKLIGEIFAIICVVNTLLLLAEIIVFPFLLELFKVKIPFHPFFLLGIVNNFFDVISIIPLALYRVRGETQRFFILSVSRIILQYITTYILVVIFNEGLIGSLYARLIINIPFGIIYFLIISGYSPIKLNLKRLREALHFSMPLLPGSISYLIFTISDRIILERFVSLDIIGIYSVAFTISLALNVIVQALYKTFEPILFKAYATSDFDKLNKKLYKYYLLLIYLGGFILSIYSKELFHFIGSPAFKVGAKIVPAMVLSVVISGVTLYLNTVLIAEKRQKIISIAIVISAIISIAFNLLLIPKFGYYAAVGASLIASLTSNLIAHYFADISGKLLLQQVCFLIIIVLTPYLLDTFNLTNNLVISICIKALAIGVFGILALFLLKCNIKEDWKFQLS
jgi:O-antigen/teichoic acid export membrane protein